MIPSQLTSLALDQDWPPSSAGGDDQRKEKCSLKEVSVLMTSNRDPLETATWSAQWECLGKSGSKVLWEVAELTESL